MIRYFCDCCKREIEPAARKTLYKISWYCHLTDIVNGKKAGYSDGEGNSISGCEDAIER